MITTIRRVADDAEFYTAPALGRTVSFPDWVGQNPAGAYGAAADRAITGDAAPGVLVDVPGALSVSRIWLRVSPRPVDPRVEETRCTERRGRHEERQT